jgi:uncharacterized membrane protein
MLTWSQIFLAAGFLIMGVLHFAVPKAFASIMPRAIPRAYHVPLVFISGVAELAGGVGVLVPALRSTAGIGLLCLLIAVFPANVQMLVNAQRASAPRATITALWLRLPLQPLLFWFVWITTGVGGVFRS